MTVASSAVMMTVMTEVRMMGMIDVEKEEHTSHWLSTMVTSSPVELGMMVSGGQVEALLAA